MSSPQHKTSATRLVKVFELINVKKFSLHFVDSSSSFTFVLISFLDCFENWRKKVEKLATNREIE